jgi:hypothetical protein
MQADTTVQAIARATDRKVLGEPPQLQSKSFEHYIVTSSKRNAESTVRECPDLSVTRSFAAPLVTRLYNPRISCPIV